MMMRAVGVAFLLSALCTTTPGFAQSSQPAGAPSVRARLDAIEQEIGRRRACATPAAAETLARELARVNDLLAGKPRDKGGKPELHVVGLYGPKHWRASEVVEVTITDRPVVLVLCAYDPVRWEVKLADGAKAERVIVGGYHDQRVTWSDPARAVPVETYTHAAKQRNYFYAYERHGEEFARLKEQLKQLTGGLEVATFQGTSTGTGGPYVVGAGSPAWQAQVIEEEIEPLFREATAMSRARTGDGSPGELFAAIHYSTEQPPPRFFPNGRPVPQLPINAFSMTPMRARFTTGGPIVETTRALPRDAEQIAIDPATEVCYGITNHEVFRVDAGKKVAIPVKGDVPRMSWLCGVTFDTKRQRLVVAARVQQQTCAYSPQKDEWEFLSEEPNARVQVQGLAYSVKEDCLYRLEADPSDSTLRLCKLDPQGKPLARVEVKHTLPRDERPLRQRQLVMEGSGDKVLWLHPPRVLTPQHVEPARCVAIEPGTGAVVSDTPLRPTVAPADDFKEDEVNRLWRLLGSGDAAEAERASKRLRAGGTRALGALNSRLAPAPQTIDRARAEQLIKLLGDPQEPVRERATADLIHAGVVVADLVAEAIKQPDAPAEVQARLKLVLADISTPAARERRDLKLIEVLREIATTDAVEHLITFSGGDAASPVTRAARQALREI
jgi:hypothetical protein